MVSLQNTTQVCTCKHTKPIEDFSSIDYKDAQEQGWFNVDFLNNHIYKGVKSESHLQSLVDTEPMWELFKPRHC